MDIYGDIWKYMEIYGNIWRYMEIYGNIWRYMEIYGNIWKYVEIYGNIWKYMGCDHFKMKLSMEIYGNHGGEINKAAILGFCSRDFSCRRRLFFDYRRGLIWFTVDDF